ncbi:MAG: transposase [Candidatus Marinimicrobia bacterium]|nr:transposase [Candidatus Neomarinimicrobiota bacterium]
MLQDELTWHLGYERYQKCEQQGNDSRNGRSNKHIKGKFGSIAIQAPRDCKGEFATLVITKH